MNTDKNFPQIVRRAMVSTITDIGQLSKSEINTLNSYTKKGYLSKGKGGPYPMLKTVYAHPDYDFNSARAEFIAKARHIIAMEA